MAFKKGNPGCCDCDGGLCPACYTVDMTENSGDCYGNTYSQAVIESPDCYYTGTHIVNDSSLYPTPGDTWPADSPACPLTLHCHTGPIYVYIHADILFRLDLTGATKRLEIEYRYIEYFAVLSGAGLACTSYDGGKNVLVYTGASVAALSYLTTLQTPAASGYQVPAPTLSSLSVTEGCSFSSVGPPPPSTICEGCKHRVPKGCALLVSPCQLNQIWKSEMPPPEGCPRRDRFAFPEI